MSYIMSNMDLFFQIGAKELQKLEEIFSQNYGVFNQSFNIAKKELADLGHSRKLEMIHKSSFGAYIDITKLTPKFSFRNLSSDKANVYEEIQPLIQKLQNAEGSAKIHILVMPFFIKSKKGLDTDILYLNISNKEDNHFIINIDRVSPKSEADKSDIDNRLEAIGEKIADHFHVELHDKSFKVDVNTQEFRFDNAESIDLGIDIVTQNLLYTLYFLYKRLKRATIDTQTVWDDTMVYANNQDFVAFLKKAKLLEELGLKEKTMLEKINQAIVKQLKKRPDLDSRKLMNDLDKTFGSMKEMYAEFDAETINIEQLTEGIEAKTAELVELFEIKHKAYKDLNESRIVINEDIDRIYAEFIQLKNAIVFGMDNLIEHRGIINKQLLKFEKLEKNSQYYEDHKEVFDRIKDDLNQMIAKQEEFNHKIMDLKDKLTWKKEQLEEKKNEIKVVDNNMHQTEKALSIIQKKLQRFKQDGGKKINVTKIIEKAVARKSINRITENNNIYEKNIKLNREIEDLLNKEIYQSGGKLGRPPSKSKLDKVMIQLKKATVDLVKQPKRHKKNIKKITVEFLPVINKYQQYIEKYHTQMNNRQVLKDTLRQSYAELRRLETGSKKAKNLFEAQQGNIEKMIKKINNAKIELEDSPKGQATIDELVDHKDRLTQFVNSRADYNNKIQKINTALRRKKQSLNKTKIDVRAKLTELKDTGKKLDGVKIELEEITAMYGGSVLRRVMLKNKLRQDRYLKYLINPVEFVLKGGKNIEKIVITNKNQSNWIKEEPQYIFENFDVEELRDIAKKWNLREYQNKEKNELSSTLKFVLYAKAGFVKDNKDYLLLAALLNTDLISINKSDVGEIRKAVNQKLKGISLPIGIQMGGKGTEIEETIRIKEKYIAKAIEQKIVIQINKTKTEFLEHLRDPKHEIRDQHYYNILADEIEESGENSGPITLVKNKNPEKSFSTAQIKLKDITPQVYNKFKQYLSSNPAAWIKGSYLNDHDPNKDTMYPNDDYIPLSQKEDGKLDLESFIIMAHKSGDAALLLKGTELITLINVEDFTAAGFKDILQKTARQLANTKSVHLNRFATKANEKVFPKDKLVAWHPITIPMSNSLFTKRTMHKLYDRRANGTTMNTQDYKEPIRGTPQGVVILYGKENRDNADWRIYVRTTPQSNHIFKDKKVLVVGYVEGMGGVMDKTGWVVYNKNNNIHRKDDPNTRMPKYVEIDIKELRIVAFYVNVFTNYTPLVRILENDRTNQSGGSAISIVKHEQKNQDDMISTYAKVKDKKIKGERVCNLFTDRGTNLMDQYELQETLKCLSEEIIKLGTDEKAQKSKRDKIAVFNIIKDDEDSIINRDSLMKYLDDVDDFVGNFKMSKQTHILGQITQNIRDYYKGNEFTGIIKSKKQVLYEHIENLSKFGRHLPPLQKEIAKFIKSFDILSEKYHKDYLDMKKAKSKKYTYENLENPSLKSNELRKFITKIENMLYGDPINKLDFKFENFPINNMGKSQLKQFVRNIKRIWGQALQDERDIALLDRLILKLEILQLLMSEWIYNGLHLIPEEFDLNDFASKAEAQAIIAELSDSYKSDEEKANTGKITHNESEQLQEAIRIYGLKEKFFANIHPAGKYDPVDKDWIIFQKPDPHNKPVDEDKKVKRTVKDGERWINKINNMCERLKDFRLILMSKLYDDVPMNDLTQDDMFKFNVITMKEYLNQQIFIELEKDYNQINMAIVENKRFHDNGEEHPYEATKFEFPDHDDQGRRVKISDSDIGNINEQRKQAHNLHWVTPTEDKRKMPETEFQALTAYENDIAFLNKTLGEFVKTGGSMMSEVARSDAIGQISELLENKINKIEGGAKKQELKEQAVEKLMNIRSSSYKEIGNMFRDKNRFNQFAKNDPVSIINHRQKQVQLLSDLKTDVSKLLAGGKPTDEMENIEKIKELVLNNDMGTTGDADISSAVFKTIKTNNKSLNLPAYRLISDLELVNFMGYAHKLENELWDEDHDFTGAFDKYINTIVSGALFGDINKNALAKLDTGDLTNKTWLQQFYINFVNYLAHNNLNTFEEFLQLSYQTIFPYEGTYPKNQYNEFWDDAMWRVGDEWDQKITDREYTGLKEFYDMVGDGTKTQFSSLEKALLFSLIIHAKSLIQDQSNIVEASISQKYNKFKALVPKDTSYLVIVNQEIKPQQEVQTGGTAPISSIFGSNNDFTPGTFLMNKNLDQLRELYIYDKSCKQKVLRDNPELERNLYTPQEYDFDNFERNGMGLAVEGKSQLSRVPRIHEDTAELRGCARYRLKNTGRKENPNWTIWDLEKEAENTNGYLPIILWPIEKLNRIELGIVTIDENGDLIDTSSTNGQKKAQELKYKSLDILVETSFTDYPKIKDDEDEYTKLKNNDSGPSPINSFSDIIVLPAPP